MTADTLKTTRVLELYQDFLSGKLINKQQAAEQYHVNVRSIQRDIDSIRDFLSEQCAKEGIVRKIEYDKKENGYRLVTQEIEQLSKGEVLALCKILLESRAFTKEQVEKQLQIILNLCVSQKEKSDIEWFISNELFHYHDPAHATVDPDNLWMVAQAIRNQSVLEIEYQKLKDRQIVKRMVEPVGLMFSEYYFYLMAVITDHSTREAFHKKNDPYPTIYRLDRMHSIKDTGEKFSVPYKDRFKEGEYKNRTQFMFGGEPQKISFNYYGPSVEAVLDKFPMAKVVDEKEGVCSIEAEVFGTGVKMWLLSQGSKVKVTAPEILVQEMKQEIERMNGQYSGGCFMKMVANETELRNALKERAPEITIVTSYADTVKKKYGLDLKANPLGKMLVTGFGPVVNHFMNPIGEELSWYKIQFYTPGKLVIEREK